MSQGEKKEVGVDKIKHIKSTDNPGSDCVFPNVSPERGLPGLAQLFHLG